MLNILDRRHAVSHFFYSDWFNGHWFCVLAFFVNAHIITMIEQRRSNVFLAVKFPWQDQSNVLRSLIVSWEFFHPAITGAPHSIKHPGYWCLEIAIIYLVLWLTDVEPLTRVPNLTCHQILLGTPRKQYVATNAYACYTWSQSGRPSHRSMMHMACSP